MFLSAMRCSPCKHPPFGRAMGEEFPTQSRRLSLGFMMVLRFARQIQPKWTSVLLNRFVGMTMWTSIEEARNPHLRSPRQQQTQRLKWRSYMILETFVQGLQLLQWLQLGESIAMAHTVWLRESPWARLAVVDASISQGADTWDEWLRVCGLNGGRMSASRSAITASVESMRVSAMRLMPKWWLTALVAVRWEKWFTGSRVAVFVWPDAHKKVYMDFTPVGQAGFTMMGGHVGYLLYHDFCGSYIAAISARGGVWISINVLWHPCYLWRSYILHVGENMCLHLKPNPRYPSIMFPWLIANH